MAFSTPKQFPEKPRSSHAPDGEKPGFHKSSASVGHGHTDHPGRMPHPQQQPVPNDESGEGCGGM